MIKQSLKLLKRLGLNKRNRRLWLFSFNYHLDDRPIDLIKQQDKYVIEYLEYFVNR